MRFAIKYLITIVFSLSITGVSQAQVTGDRTLSTTVTAPDNQNFTVTGGEQVGGNLYHSFQELSVPTNGSIIFNHAEAIQNIISRVTGGAVSQIDGKIQSAGAANLILINPYGIIFGPNAQLQINGSFLATTAASIQFADGSVFSATNPQTQPLLTMSTPIGLQFGTQSASITIQDQPIILDTGRVTFASGLQMQPEKTIALVGGGILMESGVIRAPGGSIELGSVGSNSYVSLEPLQGRIAGWRLGYDGVEQFNEVQLTQKALAETTYPLDTGFGTSGPISVYGSKVTFTDDSQFSVISGGLEPGGVILIKATESVELTTESDINSVGLFSGISGQIIIETQRLLLSDGFIDVSADFGGTPGSITIKASDWVEVTQGGRIVAQAIETAQSAGDIEISTQKLMITGGGIIATSTFGEGNGGNININATELVQVEGKGVVDLFGTVGSSQIGAFTRGDYVPPTGKAGNINITTSRLVVQDTGRITVASVASENGTEGAGGNLNINASDTVIIRGMDSTLEANSDTSGNAGNLTVNTNMLQVLDGAKINVAASSTGVAGNLTVNANSLLVENAAQLNASTAAGEGNIILDIQDSLLLRNQGDIITNATGSARGGNISIDTATLTALQNSRISANAQQGFGGEVLINTQGLFVSPDSKITATSEAGPQYNGIVEINGIQIDPSKELSSLPQNPEVAPLLTQTCQTGENASSFVVVGKGGLPPGPEEIGNMGYWDDIREPNLNQKATPVVITPPSSPNQIIEATGWIVDENGKILLVAQFPHSSHPGLTQFSTCEPR